MLILSKRQKLVHLNALRAFEAAARNQSFLSAAEELNVTPPAISQHIRALEEYLDVKLFVRSRFGVALTQEAKEAYPDIRDGLQLLASGLARMRSSGQDRIVTMTVPPSFAAKWLLPRIERFREQHPNLDIRLDATNRLADFTAEGVDIGVRYGLGGYAGLSAEKLMPEDIFPVCSPRLLTSEHLAPEISQLAKMTLIHDTTIDFDPTFPTWQAWFGARGFKNIDPARGLQFNSSVLAIQAAVDGQGIALGRSVLVAGDIAAGRLVRPFDEFEETHCAYHVVYEPKALEKEKIKAVRDWLFREAGNQPDNK